MNKEVASAQSELAEVSKRAAKEAEVFKQKEANLEDQVNKLNAQNRYTFLNFLCYCLLFCKPCVYLQ